MSLQNPKYSVQWLCLHMYNSYCNNFGEKNAWAGSRTRINCLEGNYATVIPLTHSKFEFIYMTYMWVVYIAIVLTFYYVNFFI